MYIIKTPNGIVLQFTLEGSATVCMQVLEMPEALRGQRLIQTHRTGRFNLYSAGSPELRSDIIFIRGSSVINDHDIARKHFLSKKDAVAYILDIQRQLGPLNPVKLRKKWLTKLGT